jgi:hypothetical protein
VLSAKSPTAWAAKHEWSDGDESLLEDILSEVVVGLEAIGKVAAEASAKRREEERVRAEEAARQAKERSRRRIDDNRWRRVRELACAWEEADRLRRFIAAVEMLAASCGDPGSDVSEWLSWARARADAMDPLCGSAADLVSETLEVNEWTYREERPQY